MAIAVLMFGVFFIDSLGFLRLSAEAPYMQGAWQSADVGVRVFIGVVHVVGAWAAGVFYRAFDYRILFTWTLGLFALVHLLYTFPLRVGQAAPVLAEPMIYALAVSIYTVDHGDDRPQCVGLSGWSATFVSTGLALRWSLSGVDLASQSLAVIRTLGMDPEKVNVNGGAIALGHPLGCTGAKLTVQMLGEIARRAFLTRFPIIWGNF